MSIRNLPEIRKWNIDGISAFGARLHETLTDMKNQISVLAQQGNFNVNGNPSAPPMPQSLKVVPHPQGVQFAISHDGNYYQGLKYEIDATANGVTHTYDVGSSRNGFLPVGPLTANYQVRAMYPNGTSSTPVPHPGPVVGGSISTVTLLPSQGAGTTKAGQPPGFGGPFTTTNGAPPVRTT